MSSTGYVIPVNPSELASRVHWHDPSEDIDDMDGELTPEEEAALKVDLEDFASYYPEDDFNDKVLPLLGKIPQKEADFLELHYIHKKIQADIAIVFNITQAAVSYRLARGLKRLKYLVSGPAVTEEEMRRDLAKIFPAKLGCPKCERTGKAVCPICKGSRMIMLDIEILVNMWDITCQSKVAEKLGLTQGRVRHRFFRAVKTLEAAAKEDPSFEPYHQIFATLANKGFCLRSEVILSQWAGRGIDCCL